jgi:hypothetical protein
MKLRMYARIAKLFPKSLVAMVIHFYMRKYQLSYDDKILHLLEPLIDEKDF